MSRLTTYERDGLVFDVRDSGPEDGDPVVLLHGFPERAETWRKVEPLLHEAGLRTLAPDQRGYSRGARPRGRRAYRIGELVADVAALVDRVGGPVHLVGHDWGSVVAWSLASRRPELVRTLTAVSVPHPTAYLRSVVTSRQLLDSWYIAGFQLPLVPERVLAGPHGTALLRATGMRDDDLAHYRRGMVEDGALPGALGWYRALPFLGRGAGPVSVPTTMVWSDGDTAVARSGVDRTAPLVHADYRLVVLEGVSHWIPTQAPEPLAAAVVERVRG